MVENRNATRAAIAETLRTGFTLGADNLAVNSKLPSGGPRVPDMTGPVSSKRRVFCISGTGRRPVRSENDKVLFEGQVVFWHKAAGKAYCGIVRGVSLVVY